MSTVGERGGSWIAGTISVTSLSPSPNICRMRMPSPRDGLVGIPQDPRSEESPLHEKLVPSTSR
jgi:hypothetical protein